MRREIPSIAAMAALLIGSQIAAIALSPIFAGAGFQAFQSPQDVTNTVIYLIMILAFTAVILALVRYKRQNLAKYVIMASIFITLAFILLLPLFYGLDYATGGTADGVLLGNVATVLAFAVAAGLVYLLVKFPEWYVVDAIGIMTAAGVTAILGISFGTLPAILLLIALAFYDAWAVYRTKHMITLADELTSQRLPILLVIPKRAGYSFRQQKSLKEQVASGEEREAMFVGLGDLIIPGIMAVSAFTFSSAAGRSFLGVLPNGIIAFGTILGSLVGFIVLMRYVLKGNPQAGLPLLNGGALLGFIIASLLVYGTVHIV
jgi:presenilin-like A22 family membrane protease